MMNRFFALLAVAAILCGICTGRADALTNVVLEEGAGAIELCIYLTGGMCVWGGLLRIAQCSGLTDRLAACFAKPACWLFPGLNPKGTALPAITMNFAANLLGLGNAATPFGLTAVDALKKRVRLRQHRLGQHRPFHRTEHRFPDPVSHHSGCSAGKARLRRSPVHPALGMAHQCCDADRTHCHYPHPLCHPGMQP